MEFDMSLNESMSFEEHDKLRTGWCMRFIPTTSLGTEILNTFRLSWALIIVSLTTYSTHTVTLMFGGHAGKFELSVISLSNCMITIFVWATLGGFTSICDTVFPQTYGSKNYKMMGTYLQRCLILHLLPVTIIILVCFCVEPLVSLIEQDKDIVRATSQYLINFSPSVLAIALFLVLKQYLYAQDIIYPYLFISISSLILHSIIQYIIFNYTNYGLAGSAFGHVFTNYYLASSTLMYIYLSGIYKNTWDGWSWSCIDELGEMLKLAVYGTFLQGLEWWAYEIMLILSALLGTTELTAQSIVLHIDTTLLSLTEGFSVAVGIQIGWHIGAGRPLSAVTASTAGLIVASIVSSIMSTIILTTRYTLPRLFTNDPDVIELASEILLYLSIYLLLDGISTISRYVIRSKNSHC